MIRWRVLGASRRGASHVRSGLPNQDSLGWHAALDDTTVALAVADGHGSARCTRSDIGARLAVRAALDVLATLAEPDADPTTVKRAVDDRLAKALVRRWEEKVAFHLRIRPLEETETDVLGGESPTLAYGSTVVATLLTPSFAVSLQLGDGDLLVVTDDGAVSRPLPADPRLLGTSTTSLCGEGAVDDVRARFHALSGSPPAMVLLTTDGYPTSFVDDDAFLRVGSDLLGALREHGPEPVEQQLPAWLDEASVAGSGDDATVALAFRP